MKTRLLCVLCAAGMFLLLAGCSEDSISPPPEDGSTKLKTTDFSASEDCRGCHPDQYREWSGSMHAYALRDPVFVEVRRIGQSMYVNALDKACEQCHSPIGSRTDDIQWGPIDFDKLAKPSQDGIGCELCHTITGIAQLNNGNVLLTPGHTKYGTIKSPISTDAHGSEYSLLYTNSEYCGACHDFVTGGGLELETTFREWRESGFYVTGKTCNECHMPAYQGQAAVGGPVRTVHRHTMVGVDLALIDFPQKDEQFELVRAMLQDAITMDVVAPDQVAPGGDVAIEVRLTNDRTGHNVPSGVPFNRQMWLSVIARDALQRVIYASGQLDTNGDLMNGSSVYPERDLDLFNAQSTMRRQDGAATGFTWDAVSHDNPSIIAGETRYVPYKFVVPAEVSGPIAVEVVLRFRSFPPYVFRALGLDQLLPIPIIDMEQATRQITLN